ncbi:MAG: SEA (Seh1-associated) complex subunit [Phylliscum demangeonii]|nr:MAG: SEA (Seh1-associated) complex subunit [Phylliscum demangeonii]
MNYAATHGSGLVTSSGRLKDDLSATDVKWSHGGFSTTIATAAPNGRVMLFDLNRVGFELAKLHDHNRQVHKLAFNPHQGSYLLSGSQDATLRLWDLRTIPAGRGVMTFRSSRRYQTNADGIRDVKWSPTDGTEFACGTDSGWIQKWDFRKENAPLLKIPAHRKVCHAIDWHPDGKHVVSAGGDKMMHVWDFSSSDRRQNASWSIRGPQVVHVVRWRPVEWKTNLRGIGAWETTQLVASYDQTEPRVHIWDFCRPYTPFKEINQYHSTIADVLWQSGDLLWTVGADGIFTQTDIQFVPKLDDQQHVQPFDVSLHGDITFAAEKRPGSHHDPDADSTAHLRNQQGKTRSGEKFSESRSTDDEVASGFLAASFARQRGRTWNIKSSKSAGNTPPSEGNALARKLDEMMSETPELTSQQVVYSGLLPTEFGTRAYAQMAAGYHYSADKITLGSPGTLQYDDAADERLLYNAQVAELAETKKKQRDDTLAQAPKQPPNPSPRDDPKESKPDDLKLAQPTTDPAEEKIANNTESASKSVKSLKELLPAPRAQGGLNKGEEPSGGSSSYASPFVDAVAQPFDAAFSAANVAMRSESHAESLELQQPETASTSDQQDMDSAHQRSPRRLPLHLDTPQASDQVDLSLRIQRLDSVGSLHLFSTSSDGSHHSKTPRRLSLREAEIHEAGSTEKEIGEIGDAVKVRQDEEFRHDELDSEPILDWTLPQPDVRRAAATKSDGPDDSKSHNTPDLRQSTEPSRAHKSTTLNDQEVEGGVLASSSKDVLPTPEDDDPFNAANLLRTLVDYFLGRLNDALTAAAIILVVRPYVPAGTIPELQVMHIMMTLHSQLIDLRLFTQAAELRNLCYPAFPSVYRAGQEKVELKMICTDCRGRIFPLHGSSRNAEEAGGQPRVSTRAAKVDAPSRAACMSVSMSGDLDPAEAGGVRGDDWVVGESRAVERVRGGLVAGGDALARGTGPPRPLSLGARRVKIVSPSEDGTNHHDH